ncbi:MAG: thiamine-phosphate kinase [Candidatus Longimicrobiales bacterium M2_2A_002]
MPVTHATPALSAIRENRLLTGWAALLERAPGQRGAVHETDAELLPLGDGRFLALTVDSVVEELEVGLYSPRTAGRVAVIACLSDLAAVGATPLGMLLSVTLPRSGAETTQAAVAAGVRAACGEAGTFVLGGDTSEGDRLHVTVVGAGTVPAGAAMTRRGCAPGDLVYATGPLGLGGAHAAAALMGLGPAPPEFEPPIRSRAGVTLRGVATACIDSSDGLVAAVDQLARLNGVAIRIAGPLHRLLHPAARAIARSSGLPAFPFLAGHHGEFELIFTVPAGSVSALAEAAERGGFRPLRLGRVEAGGGVWIGASELDTTGIRNLAEGAGSDVEAYTAALIAASPS